MTTGSCAPGATLGVMDMVVRWWDSVELWLTGLPFVVQVSLVLVVLVLIALGVVRLLTRLIDLVADTASDLRHRHEPKGSKRDA